MNSPTLSAVGATLALSWVGLYLHNQADLPHLTLLSPENSIPAIVALGLYLAYSRRPAEAVLRWLLLGWGVLHLVGGAISVLPLDFLPFDPAQTTFHYTMHLVYAVAQIPLIVLMLRARPS